LATILSSLEATHFHTIPELTFSPSQISSIEKESFELYIIEKSTAKGVSTSSTFERPTDTIGQSCSECSLLLPPTPKKDTLLRNPKFIVRASRTTFLGRSQGTLPNTPNPNLQDESSDFPLKKKRRGLTTKEVGWSSRSLNQGKDAKGVCTDAKLEEDNAEAKEEDKLLARQSLTNGGT